jgi:DNA-binding HxlR family transcriptional regulator
MSNDCYNHFCPVAKACEILEPRWTLLILCEMWGGSTRFNDIRRGVPGISPTLLSKRLKEIEANGLIERSVDRATGEISYVLSPIAIELKPIIFSLGQWAHRNIDAEVTLEHIDARVLMWNMRRKIDTAVLPRRRRSVIQFIYPELPPEERNYWIIGKPGLPADLCSVDPGFDVNLYITADLKALTAAWMGYSTLAAEIARDKVSLIGDKALAASINDWMAVSSYAEAGARPQTSTHSARASSAGRSGGMRSTLLRPPAAGTTSANHKFAMS